MTVSIGIRVDVNVEQLLLRMQKGEKKLAYGVVNAINATALRMQQAGFERVRQEFIIRGPAREALFFGAPGRPGGAAGRLRRASVSQQRPYAEIALESKASSKGAPVLLPIFERGGPRPKSTQAAQSVAIPLTGRPARPSIRGPVPPQYTFQGLRFRAYQGRKKLQRRRRGRTVDETVFKEFGRVAFSNLDASRGIQWKGEQRTFVLKHSAREPLGAVFQRFGRGPEGIRELYPFRDPKPLEPRLHYVETLQRSADQWFGEELERQAVDALAHEVAAGRA